MVIGAITLIFASYVVIAFFIDLVDTTDMVWLDKYIPIKYRIKEEGEYSDTTFVVETRRFFPYKKWGYNEYDNIESAEKRIDVIKKDREERKKFPKYHYR